jgi:hypothetical protein
MEGVPVFRIRLLLGVGLAVVGMAVAPVAASAYGNSAVYQLTFSLNCDNPSYPLCSSTNGVGLGGTWGWIELDNTGTYDATMTFCGHQNPGQPNGAFHVNVKDAPWITTDLQTALKDGNFPVGTDPNNQYLVPLGAPAAFPATPGHYSMKLAPGVSLEAQVTKV